MATSVRVIASFRAAVSLWVWAVASGAVWCWVLGIDVGQQVSNLGLECFRALTVVVQQGVTVLLGPLAGGTQYVTSHGV